MRKATQIKLLLDDGSKITLDLEDNTILLVRGAGPPLALDGTGFAMAGLNEQIKALIEHTLAEAGD